MRLGRLGAHARAEVLEARFGPAEGDDVLDRRNRRADARHLRLRLESAAEDAEPRRAVPREMLRRDAARGAGAQLPEDVRLDHADAPAVSGVEEDDDERGDVCLHAGDAEAAVDRAHERERSTFER